MSMSPKTVVMIGYDIRKISGYINKLEEDNEDWSDGIPDYSLNYSDVKIGYESHTKGMFGKVIFDTDKAFSHATEVGNFESFSAEYFEGVRAVIWDKYRHFLFDHTKITEREEPPFVLNFITWFW